MNGVLVLAAACLLALAGCPGDDPPEVKVEICNNTIDDDTDGKADCLDSDCAADAACKVTVAEICNNTIDDDKDGQVDCLDPDCDTADNCDVVPPVENCTNAADDDNDGKIDCNDEDCANTQICNPVELCDNGLDDEGDFRIDCEDADCAAAANCAVTCTVEGETACGRDCCAAADCKAGVCVGTTVEGCLLPAEYGTVTMAGDVETDTGLMALEADLPATSGTDKIRLELWEGSGAFAGGYQSGVITLTADDLDYKTCGFCLRLWGDIAGETIGANYFLTGAATVNVASFEEKVIATVTDADFEHVNYATDWTTTPHADGCVTTMGKVLIDGVLPLVEDCVNGTDDDEDNLADCLDPDCNADQACLGTDCWDDPLNTCADGEGCQYVTGIGLFCAEAGEIAVGSACAGFGTCVTGAECWGGTCVTWCIPGGDDTCAAGTTCDGLDAENTVGACFKPVVTCDPSAPDCPEGELCYYSVNAEGYACQELTAGTVAIGGECQGTTVNECVPGAECLTLTGSETSYCFEVCNPASPACTDNWDCSSFTEDDSVGACLEPAVVCNPVGDLTECETGEACSFDSNEGEFVCKAPGTLEIGAACTGLGACVEGAECVGGFCRAYCTPGETPALVCANQGVCEKATDDGLVGTCWENCAVVGDEDLNGVEACADAGCTEYQTCVDAICLTATAETGLTFTADNTAGTQGATGSCGGSGKEVLRTVSAGVAGEVGQLTIEVTTPFDAVVYVRDTCTELATQLGCADKVEGTVAAPKTEKIVINDYAGANELTLVLDAYETAGVGIFTVKLTFVPRVCGNGTIEYGETCDDAQATPVAGDGCDLVCKIEAGFACPTVGQACRAIVCGDTFVDAPEVCEPDAVVENQATDGCSATCTAAPVEISVPYDLTGTGAEGSIAVKGDKWYSVVVAADSKLTAEILDTGDGACAAKDLDSKLGLYDIDGKLIVIADDGGAGYCSKLVIPNLPAATYLLRVYGYDEETAFAYKLVVTLAAVEACTAAVDYSATASVLTGTAGVMMDPYGFGIEMGIGATMTLNADPDELDLALYDGYGVFKDGIVASPTPIVLAGDELSPDDCGLCMQITEANGKTYIPTGGSVTLTSVAGKLTGSFENVTFTEAIGGMVVPNACPSKITSASFDLTIAPGSKK